jgi:hypothetical protein
VPGDNSLQARLYFGKTLTASSWQERLYNIFVLTSIMSLRSSFTAIWYIDGGEMETRTVDCSEISPDLSADGLADEDEYELLIPSQCLRQEVCCWSKRVYYLVL